MSGTGSVEDFNPQPDPPGSRASEPVYPPGPTATGTQGGGAQVPTDSGVIIHEAEASLVPDRGQGGDIQPSI